MSTKCTRFVENAWRKDMCTNCFKQREEHKIVKAAPRMAIAVAKSVKLMEPPKSIIKKQNTQKKSKSRHKVSFPKEFTQLIGYGGGDWSDAESTDEESEMSSASSNEDTSYNNDKTDDNDKELQQLTKSNTDFNMNKVNLMVSKPTEPSAVATAPKYLGLLKLGAPQVDSEGKKKTLKVNVVPMAEKYIPYEEAAKAGKTAMAKKILAPATENKSPNSVSATKVLESKITSSREVASQIVKNPEPESHAAKDVVPPVTKAKDNGVNLSKQDECDVKPSDIIEPCSNNKQTQNETLFAFKETIPEKTKADEVSVTTGKRSITRHVPITKNHAKPKITVFPKSITSSEVKIDLKDDIKTGSLSRAPKAITESDHTETRSYPTFSNQLISHMFSCQSESSNDIYGQITADGLVMTNSNESDEACFSIDKSRELAGEPDGSADPDCECEAPPLPTSPPPLHVPRSSFLHNGSPPTKETATMPNVKPTIPVKPKTNTMPKMTIGQNGNHPQLNGFIKESTIAEDQEETESADVVDFAKMMKKGRAPNPPNNERYSQNEDSETYDDVEPVHNQQNDKKTILFREETNKLEESIYVRNPFGSVNSNSPVIRVKGKRERVQINPKFYSLNPAKNKPKLIAPTPLQPEHRNIISMSQDCLAGEKDKNKSKRFSLRKFLGIGTNRTSEPILSKTKILSEDDCANRKSRLVIIHPIDINKIEAAKSDAIAAEVNKPTNAPPTPPARTVIEPRPMVLQAGSGEAKQENIYSNLGECRSRIAPKKPERSSSMSEKEKRLATKIAEAESIKTEINVKMDTIQLKKEDESETVERSESRQSSSSTDSSFKSSIRSSSGTETLAYYEDVDRGSISGKSDQECDKKEEMVKNKTDTAGSDGKDVNCNRHFYENVTSRFRSHSLESSSIKTNIRKGRSIIHKSFEDNYQAVIAANHEALAQVLDQHQKIIQIPSEYEVLAKEENIRLTMFEILKENTMTVGQRAFYAAIWDKQLPVTLAITTDCNNRVGSHFNQLIGPNCRNLNPIAEFCDLVPRTLLPDCQSFVAPNVQASISILPRMDIDTLQTFGNKLRTIYNVSANETMDPEELKSSVVSDLLCREVGLVMLQLVNGLKSLQAKGIEEFPLNLSTIVVRTSKDEQQPRLSIIYRPNQDIFSDRQDPTGTLCQCAHIALTKMLPSTKLSSILSDILLKDRSESLSKAKFVCEFALWGPNDVTTLSNDNKERELSFQRWLDLERATMLHGLLKSQEHLSVFDECHLKFLVHANAKTMCEASAIVFNHQKVIAK